MVQLLKTENLLFFFVLHNSLLNIKSKLFGLDFEEL